MADVAGLVLGVAGLVGAFKDAIDLFTLLADSRDLGRDYEILNAKLDIEKVLLLQWADRIKLLRRDYDQRLNDPDTERIVAHILSCIALLLSDSSELQQRYGLSEVSEYDHSVTDSRTAHQPISERRMGNFIKEFEDLKLRINIRSQTAPARKKARWVIRDKRKFEEMIKDLSYFTARINDVVPIVSNDGYTSRMADEDLANINLSHQNLRQLKILLDASADFRHSIAESIQRAYTEACQGRILSKLWFRRIDDRREGIPIAHGRTLQWALEPPRLSGCPWDDLSKWLQCDSGIYWISGKAGSGKSTLMKYLYSEVPKRDLLSLWANGDKYFVCNFFFSNLGTFEQKSQEGLFRTLLYQILDSHRSLIPEVLPHMWKELYNKEDAELPSQAEMKCAFETISRMSDMLGRFCLFIDGLDEFVGDYMDGVAFIKSLAANEHIKIIVSSRPIPDCVTAFSDLPKLQLQDLTRDDITLYVEDVIGSHRYMKKLLGRYPSEGREIMKDVAEKSSGVFLWVILACRSLLSGFSDYDRIPDLRRRVDELPRELADMFQHMLSQIPRRHREHGSQLLQICYAHQNQSGSDMYALGLALIDDYHTNTVCIKALTLVEKRGLCEDLEGRLRSRCGGLLEFGKGDLNLESYCLCGAWLGAKHDVYIDSRVVFMHRTVFEFLSDETVWEIECLKTSEGRFNVPTALSLYGLHLAMQSLNLQPPLADQASYFLLEGLRWGVQSDMEMPDDPRSFFRNLQTVLDTLEGDELSESSLQHLYVANRHGNCPLGSHVTLLLAIEAGAVNCVKQHPYLHTIVKHDRISCGCLPLLFHAVRRVLLERVFGNVEVDFMSREMIDLLLSYGCSPGESIHPNDEASSTTPWITWLKDVQGMAFERVDNFKILDTAERFLRADADPQPTNISLKGWIGELFIENETNEAVRERACAILRLIEELREMEGAPSTPGDMNDDIEDSDDEGGMEENGSSSETDNSSDETDKDGVYVSALISTSGAGNNQQMTMGPRLSKRKRSISPRTAIANNAKRVHH
ncbi:hypothetical protein RRF57_012737 [Xylaria bambusicola]|uniref:Prion-inhibition and propagation HeLo domain-containing protein n=1 Tax=Xylaria bambusicola TaxID=326684 RepID=A0AAN7Z4S1_9PEZI